MVGNPENFGGGSGESKWQSSEYARGILQKVGKKVLSDELENELRNMPRAELMQHFGIEPTQGLYYEVEGGLRAGMGTDEAYKEIFGNRYNPEGGGEAGTEENEPDGEGENTPETEAERAIAKVVEASKDRYGNSMSAESIANLQKLAVEDPEKFAAEILEWNLNQQREAAEKGYLNVQREIASLLEGRAPEEFLEIYAHDINKLRNDIKSEEKKIVAVNRTNQLEQYKTDEAREFKEKQLAEMRGLLREMERKYALVANLQKGSKEAVPVSPNSVDEILEVPEDEEREQPKDLRLELLDVNNPNYDFLARMRRGEFERVAKFMMPEEAERLLKQLTNAEELEQQLKQKAQNDFEEPEEDEEVSEDEIEKTAEEVGGSKRQKSKKAVEKTPEEKERDRSYRKAMSELAKESKPGRFGDPELPPENRERLLSKLKKALKGRKSLKKAARKATLGLVLALTLTGVGTNIATALNGSNTAYAAELENTDSVGGDELAQSGLTGDSAAELAESLGMSAEDLMGGEIDYSKHDLLAEGDRKSVV